MAKHFDLVLEGGTVVSHAGKHVCDIGVVRGQIAALGQLKQSVSAEVINCTGLHILPGVIDTHVHFREPGALQKEDLASGSLSAVMGGVTAFFEMPNTTPPTTSAEALASKVAIGTDRAFCDFAFYVGATLENIEELGHLERLPGCCGIKVFMGASTGTLLVESDEGIAAVLRQANRRVAFHSEDEERLRRRVSQQREGDPSSHSQWRDAEAALLGTRRLLKLASEAGKRIHVLHVTTSEEMQLLALHKAVATVEVTPQHLTLTSPEAYDRLGTRAQMNPPLRDETHAAGLWLGTAQGVADTIGSDHAPHTLEEKAKSYPLSPSGMPGVQTLVPIMLDHVNAGRLSLESFVDLTAHGPQRVFGIANKGRIAVGYDADFTIVDLKMQRLIEDKWIASRCGWTPFAGRLVTGWPVGTVVRGQRVVWEDQLLLAEGAGKPVRFSEALHSA
ncbi:dihydroorotase [Rhodoligotrophos appendicifer]|uniref:dihydroorotase n=1 Tax=Rhodoligotrophos appendicifer TaxID=987056 RepID=UPI0011856624|nr:dihydroorotase [Rhodoligotrophos appendicifer]